MSLSQVHLIHADSLHGRTVYWEKVQKFLLTFASLPLPHLLISGSKHLPILPFPFDTHLLLYLTTTDILSQSSLA